MKKYVYLTAIATSLFLTSCTADDLYFDSSIKQNDNLPAGSNDLNLPPNESIPPKTKDKDD